MKIQSRPLILSNTIVTLTCGVLAISCTTVIEQPITLRPCDPTGSTGSTTLEDTSTSTDAGDTSISSDESSAGEDTCPDMRGGSAHTEGSAVTFCPGSLDLCRDVLVVNAAGATGDGPIVVQWHGTYENPDGYLSWDYATGSLRSMVAAEDGLLVLPYADQQATGRTGPFPWWAVGDPDDPAMQTDRIDDFVLFDEVVRCALDQGLAAPDRVTTSGMSAGAIMVSHIVDRHDDTSAGYEIAAAVSWSGGLPPQYQPATPTAGIPMMLTQGGTDDVYCGPGNHPGTCNGYELYSFVQPTEHLASSIVEAGSYAFVCRHPWGHASVFGPTAADWFRLARAGQQHPWEPYTTTFANDWSIAYCGEAL